MKSYTDLAQSKKLAEILPIVSADMWYSHYGHPGYNSVIAYNGEQWFLCQIRNSLHDIPCWSLTALLSLLPDEITDNGDVYRNMFFHLKGKYIIQYPRLTTLWPSLLSVEADNPIDACVDMITEIKEKNLL